MNKLDRAKSLIDSVIKQRPIKNDKKFRSWFFMALEVVYKISYTFNVSDKVLADACKIRDEVDPKRPENKEKDLMALLKDAYSTLENKEE